MQRIQQAGSYHYTLSAAHEPIARVSAGAEVWIECIDAFGNRVDSEEQKLAGDNPNPQTGPIYVEGAEPGDALCVDIFDIRITRDYAVSGLVPGFGLFDETPSLRESLPDTAVLMPIKNQALHWKNFQRPLAPFLGTMGVASRREAISSLTATEFGGNLDCPELCPGSTLMFPVAVAGAYFFCGDGHACQGHGEISGVAAEVPVDLHCRLRVEKNLNLSRPRISTETHLMCVASARPLEAAIRLASKELLSWVSREYQIEEREALIWLGQTLEIRVGNVVDPNYSVIAAVDRGHLSN